MYTGVIALGLGLMSFTSNSTEVKEEAPFRHSKAWYHCEDGSDGWIITDGFSDADVEEMLSSACN